MKLTSYQPLLISGGAAPPACALHDALLAAADEALHIPPLSVVHKDIVPPSGDKHDWMNLADYTWPNPDTNDGLPYVNRDGEANPEARRYDRPRFNRLVLSALRLTAAWRVTGRESFARKAAELLETWFVDPATAMTPHLRYAHHVPGSVDGRKDGLIVFCSALPSLLDSWLALRGGRFIDDDRHAAMRDWAGRFLEWLETDPMSLEHAEAANNHGTFHEVLVCYLMLFVGRLDAAGDMLAASLDRRLAEQVGPDGQQPHETHRTLSAQYSLYNLKALMSLARLGERVGVDGWRAGSSAPPIREAARYLYRHASGETTWPHPQIAPPTWWFLVPLCRAVNRAYGDTFDLARIDLSAPAPVPPEPVVFTEGWELAFAPSHRQHLPAGVSE
jgi:hypothetical protein